MLAFFACLVATQVPVGQPPRLRTILPNGASIIIARVPGAKTLAVELCVSSRGTEETSVTNGLRHLLEHLVARGPKGDIDQTLETAGGFLEAETQRSATVFKLTLPSGQLALGLKTLGQIMQMPIVTTESIQHETQVIAQEIALRSPPSEFSAAAWMKSFGERGLDVVGNLDVMRNATPEMLDKIHRTEFSGPNLSIAVAGDVDLDAATSACSNILASAPPATFPKADRRVGEGGSTSTDAVGHAIAVPVEGWRYPDTAARLAAAFALASEVDNCYVVYTPSAFPGLILIGQSTSGGDLSKIAAKSRANDLFVRGRQLARSWVLGMLRSPQEIADIRGLLMVQEVDLRPETMLENLDTMTPKAFSSAVEMFRSNFAVTVEGK